MPRGINLSAWDSSRVSQVLFELAEVEDYIAPGLRNRAVGHGGSRWIQMGRCVPWLQGVVDQTQGRVSGSTAFQRYETVLFSAAASTAAAVAEWLTETSCPKCTGDWLGLAEFLL